MYTKIATLSFTLCLLGGCGTMPGFSWDGSFQTGLTQPKGRPHDDGYRVHGRLVDDLGDYGERTGYCTSNGEIVWDNR